MIGIANTTKLAVIDNPTATNTPPTIGPKIAPVRPAPIAHPMPVVLITVGYKRAAIVYRPTKPPCTPNPIKPNIIKIVPDSENKENTNINIEAPIRKIKIVLRSPNNCEK